MLRRILSIALLAFIISVSEGSSRASSAANNLCPKDASASAAYCKYFVHFNKQESAPDPAIASAIELSSGDKTRSVALIMGVDTYDKKQELNLPPAREDVKNLQDFLVTNQKFDEVIVLRNKEVNIENINYFMGTYFIKFAQLYPKSRILVAYSGHGLPGNARGSKGYLVLSEYSGEDDFEHLLSLGVFTQYLSELGPQAFQTLLLINSCHGGDLFAASYGGGNRTDGTETTAWAITAGSPDDLVYSLGQPGQGSIFFDSIIKNVKSGAPENYEDASFIEGQQSHTGRGIAFASEIADHVTSDVRHINHSGEKQYPLPWDGSIEPIPVVSKGGFFLLSHKGPPPSKEALARFAGTAGAVSSVVGHPEIKIFNKPQDYEIHGIDVSKYNGDIDWVAVSKNRDIEKITPRFAYIRASMGADRQDKLFNANWKGAEAAMIDRGAYHVLDFCQLGDGQILNIQKSVPLDKDSLPLAIDVEMGEFKGAPLDSSFSKQERCLSEQGEDAERNKLHLILRSVEARYGKRPIIFGRSAAFMKFIDQSFAQYPIWLHEYNQSIGGASLAGRNPWTLWQYTDHGQIAGSNREVDQSVFFGSLEKYKDFKQSGLNYALAAATGELLK